MSQEDYDPKYKAWKQAQERKKRYAATFTPAERRAWIEKKRKENPPLESAESSAPRFNRSRGLKIDRKPYYRNPPPSKQTSPRKRDDSSGESLTCS